MSTSRAFREPFTLDVVLRALDRVPFSPPFLVLLPLLTLMWELRTLSPARLGASLPTLRGWYALLWTEHRWVGRALLFIAVKTLSRVLSRRAANNGEPRADPPAWDRDVVVVTGGATGIGKAVVEELSARYRAKIAVLDIAQPTYAPAAPGAPPILYVRTDVTERASIGAAHDTIRATFGTSPSLVVSCAGLAFGGPVLSVTLESVNKMMQINAFANVHLAQEFVPHMVQHNHGHYMTVASSGSYFTPPMMSSYCMSKAAALAFHEELRSELRVLYKAPRVRTSIVTPTKVRTLLGAGLKDTDNAFVAPTLEPIQVARAMVDALNSGLSHSVSQPLFTKVLPFVRAMPDWFRALLAAVGKTDSAVTADSMRDALRQGYGKNWHPDDFARLLGEMDATYRKDA